MQQPSQSLVSRVSFRERYAAGSHSAEASYSDQTSSTSGRQVLAHGYLVHNECLLRFNESGHQQAAMALLSKPTEELGQALQNVGNGRFNVVVHDYERSQTIIWNDRGGFLPLYLQLDAEQCTLASNYEALLAQVATRPSMDLTGLAELYRYGYTIGSRTVFKGVRLLNPGSKTTIDWNTGACESSILHARHLRIQNHRLSVSECAEQVHALISRACARLHHDNAQYGIKLSGGMDSRLIASAIEGSGVRSYTWGDSGSREMAYASALARSCGFTHEELVIDGDFYRFYDEMHRHHGLMEFFHELAADKMVQHGCSYNYDGMLGDIFFGGLGLNRINRGDQVRAALGIPPKDMPVPTDLDQVVATIDRDIAVSSASFDVLSSDALALMQKQQQQVQQDIYQELEPERHKHQTIDGMVLQFKLYNRSRRYIALQNATTRARCETLFPFLDTDLWNFAEQIPFSVLANKRLYIALYSRYYPEHQATPAIMSGMSFRTRPEYLHYMGRIARALRERGGAYLAAKGMDQFRPVTHEATQWNRWFNSNRQFQDWVREQLKHSDWIDQDKLEGLLSQAKAGRARINGTKLMLTLSLGAWQARSPA